MNLLLTIFFLLGSLYFFTALIICVVFLYFSFRLLKNISDAGADIRETTKDIKNKILKTPDFLVSLVTLIGAVLSVIKKKEKTEDSEEKKNKKDKKSKKKKPKKEK